MSTIRACVKEGTFLDAYLRWNAPLETPLAYDFWTGMWLLSSAIGRRIVIPRPGAPVYLNLYVVLCADAGVTRKSTAVARAVEAYNAVGLRETRKTITGSITPEAFVSSLAKRVADGGTGEASFVASELVRLLGREAYAGNMPGLLTDLYDCPASRSIERTGSVAYELKDVHITFLGASTAAWLGRAINPDVIEGGFTSRCLFIVDEKRKRRVAWPDGATSAAPDDVRHGLVHCQEAAKRWSGRGLSITDAARDAFVRWYERRNDSSSDPFLQSFEAREDHHVLRTAGLLAANDDMWIIYPQHIAHAIKLIDEVKAGGATLFGSAQASMRLVSGLDRLRTVLLEAGAMGIGQTELVFKTRNYLKSAELTYALTLMHEVQMVQKFEVGTSGRPKTVWRATNLIVNREADRRVRERFLEV